MPQPTARDVHVNTPLTNLSIAYLQKQEMFIASKAAPIVPSAHQSDLYYRYDRSFFFSDEMKKRAPATESAGGGYEIDTDSFFCDVYAYHKDVDAQIRANQDAAINMDRDATEFVTHKALIRREQDWADEFFTTGKWSADITPATKWDAAAGTPIKDMREQIFSIHQNTGFRPNKLVLGATAWRTLQDSDDFLGRIDFGTPNAPSIVSRQLLANVLELDEVLVGGAVKTTSVEGAASDTYGFITDDAALLAYVNPSPSLMMPSAMYQFVWSGFLGANAAGFRINRFEMPHLRADRVEVEAAWDFKLIAPELGVFFNDVTT